MAYRALLSQHADSGGAAPPRADVYNHLAVSLPEHPLHMPEGERGAAALVHARRAVQADPACRYLHAHNYYQVLAAAYRAQDQMELATAALWPVAAADRCT